MLYRLAVETGLRSSELSSLTRASFQLDGDDPCVIVAAAYSKHRREDRQPIRPEVVLLLRTYLANKTPAARAFPMPPSDRVSRMFKQDTDRASIVHRDVSGRVVDFHALRHTFISNLVSGGVYPKVAQQLARHSTVKLTLDRYTHTFQGELKTALNRLPNLTSTEPVKNGATGNANLPQAG